MKAHPRITFYHRQHSAVGYYRTWVPARYLASTGRYDVVWSEDIPYQKIWGKTAHDRNQWAAEQISTADLIWVDRLIDREAVGLFAGIRHHSPGCRMVVDFDDHFLDIPWWNPSISKYQPGQECRESGLMHLKLSEMTTTSTEGLQEAFAPRTHRIRVLENSIDPVDWEDLPRDPDRDNDPHLRVFYGGALGHYGDTDICRRGVEKLLRHPPRPWRLVVIGAMPQWLYELQNQYPQRVIRLPFVPFTDYPQAVAWGGFDLAIAPLQDHPFNRCKSNIKWLEAAIQRIPLVCSKVGPYDADIPSECALKTGDEDWLDTLEAALLDPELRRKVSDLAYEAVRDEWTIDHRGRRWENVIEEALAAPRIESLEDTWLPSERQPPEAQESPPPAQDGI